MNLPTQPSPYGSMTIAESLRLIQDDKLVLPLLQRPLVWKTERFVQLFDSILQDYPINAMLFWALPAGMNSDGRFYRFIQHFTDFPGTPSDPLQRKLNEPLPKIPVKEGALAVLDGQQRLSSFYMGLMGSYAWRVPGGWTDRDWNYPLRKLYLCITDKMPEKEDLELQPYYQLDWLEPPDDSGIPFKIKDGETWMLVSEVMTASQLPALTWAEGTAQRACDNARSQGHFWQEEVRENDSPANEMTFAKETLRRLHDAVHSKHNINFYLDTSPEFARAVAVFVRVNSAGIPLNYSDLVFSVMGSEWLQLNAKDEIAGLKMEIEKLSLDSAYTLLSHIHFDERFILRTAMLTAAKRALPFDLSQMRSSLLKEMEKGWHDARASIISACQVLGERRLYAFRARELVMVLAFYLYRCSEIKYKPTPADIAAMKQWLLRAAITWHDYKASAETKLKRYTEALQAAMECGAKSFPFKDMITKGWVSLEVRRECNPSNLDQAGIFIERLLDKPKHESGFLLGVIQKGIKADISYDIDHCYPWSEAWTRPPGMTEEKYNYYVNRMNSLVNLQLLDYSENRSKQATPFDVWFNSLPPQRQEQIRADHLIPEGHPVAAKDFGSVHEAFDRFYDTRRKLLKARLLDILDEHE